MNIRDYIGEGTEYDKKEALEVKRPKSWLKSVSAFANCKGGVLLFGISDDDIPIGVKDAEGDAEIISEAVKTRMDPVPDIGLSIRREIVDGEYRKFIVLRVYHGMETPYYYVGDGTHIAYIRVGNESVPAQATDLRRLILAGTHQTWDSLLSPYAASKFAFGRLHSAYLRRTGRQLSDTDFDSFGLIGADGCLPMRELCLWTIRLCVIRGCFVQGGRDWIKHRESWMRPMIGNCAAVLWLYFWMRWILSCFIIRSVGRN